MMQWTVKRHVINLSAFSLLYHSLPLVILGLVSKQIKSSCTHLMKTVIAPTIYFYFVKGLLNIWKKLFNYLPCLIFLHHKTWLLTEVSALWKTSLYQFFLQKSTLTWASPLVVALVFTFRNPKNKEAQEWFKCGKIQSNLLKMKAYHLNHWE